MTPLDRRGLLFVFLAAWAYACVPIFANWAYDAGLSSRDVVTWRFIIAAPLVWMIVGMNRARSADTVSHQPPVPYRVLFGLGFFYAVIALVDFAILAIMPASLFIMLIYTYPVMVAVAEAFLGEPLTARIWWALALTTTGVMLTVPDALSGLNAVTPITLLLGLFSAVLSAAYTVISNRALRGVRRMQVATALNISGALLVLLVLAAFDPPAVPATNAGWASIIALSAISTVGAIFFFLAGLKRIGAARTAILGTLEPVLVLVMSLLLLGETISALQIVGGTLIIVSPLVLQLRPTLLLQKRRSRRLSAQVGD